MKKQQTTIAGLAALALLGCAASSHAQSDVYTMSGTGGDLISSAYITTGSGVLDQIDGAFATTSATSTSGVPDLYEIDVTGAESFSASTVNSMGTAYDTQLFLFNASGLGVYTNFIDGSQELAPGFFVGAGSTLPADDLPTGLYYLGIAPEGAEPQSAGGNIFPDPLTDGVDETAVYGPTGAGGGSPLTKWSISSDDVDSGSYTITLTGAAYAVPESSTLALASLGLLPLALIARRKSQRRAAS